ncbi:MAG: DUF6242 domain-containing protein [Tannerella sp.]|jgi:hypothetical protein|nr:DUF6242 domain-containing protein [Tannerella sp.]
MRNLKTYGLLIGILSVMLTSCLGNNEYTYDEWGMKNAQIFSFYLSNDSIIGLSDVIFTVDQINGKIFNQDSMPFGTLIDEKVLCDLTFDVYGGTAEYYLPVQIMSQATGDTVFWTTSDSIDFSEPVIFKVYAADYETTKIYEAQINVHQVNPDSMVWNKFSTIAEGRIFDEMKVVEESTSYCVYARENGKVILLRSSDLENWSEIALNGFPDAAILSSITEYNGKLFVIDGTGKLYLAEDGAWWNEVTENETPVLKCILGKISDNNANSVSALCCIADVNGVLRFCADILDKGWTVGDEVPETFPIAGFGSLSYEVMYYPHLIIASGKDKNGNLTNKAWSTMNGLSWVALSNANMTFKHLEGASIEHYDNLLFLMGGFDEEENAISETYFSKDNGVTWKDTVFFPTDYKSRAYSTVKVDKDRYMLLFGGKETRDGNILNEVWRGRVNRLGFKQD